MSFIIDGRRVDGPADLTVKNYEQTGLMIPLGRTYDRNTTRINKIVLHWTAGEGNAERVFAGWEQRGGGSAHFHVDKDGTITQFADLIRACTYKSFIEIEIRNTGMVRRGSNGPTGGREIYDFSVPGETTYKLLKFFPSEISAVKSLCRFLCNHFQIPYTVPTNPDGTLRMVRMSDSELRNFTGILDHFHYHPNKLDAGPEILQAILDEGGGAITPPGSSPPGSSTPNTTPQNRRPNQPAATEPLPERLQSIAQGRTSAPTGIVLPYGILAASEDPTVADPYAGLAFDPSDIQGSIQQPFESFHSQMTALREVSTLDLAQSVPILAIFVKDIDGTEVNLNEKIFGKSPFHNIFESAESFSGINPERPLASILSFNVVTQQPSVGGPSGISVATLKLKIHNPSLATIDHPTGKYISYLMRPGFPLRVRYGVEHPGAGPDGTLSTAFQWMEDDFFVSQHQLKTSNDLTIEVDLTIISAAMKLFNQILIGENLPIDTISSQDLDAVLSTATGSAAERNTLSQDLRSVFPAAGTSDSQVGVNDFQNSSETIGSVLHGAVGRLTDLAQSDNFPAVRIANLVDGLKTIQSRLLTRRYENILGQLSYEFSGLNEIRYLAVNLGPLVYRLVKPELDKVIQLVTAQGFNIGPVTSLSVNAQQSEDESEGGDVPIVRNKIKIVFGNFNSFAGQWANKPISTFPVNMETIFGELKKERVVGRFSDSINQFISRVGRIAEEDSNYVSSDSQRRLETPILKYSFYPDPNDSENWIFYLFDEKHRVLQHTNLIDRIENEGVLTREIVKNILSETKVPFIEPSSDRSLIRNIDGNTQADDLIMTNNIIQANSRAFSQRQLDEASLRAISSGISREFITGAGLNLERIISNAPLILPLHLTVDHYIAITALLFNPIYVFFPLKQLSGIYTIQQMEHEIQKDRVSTKLSLQIQLTRRNRAPDTSDPDDA